MTTITPVWISVPIFQNVYAGDCSPNAGPDQTVHRGALVVLDGSHSRDEDPQWTPINRYDWVQVDRPGEPLALGGGRVSINPQDDFPHPIRDITLDTTNPVHPTFLAPNMDTTLHFALTVSDDYGGSSYDFVNIMVSGESPPG